MFKTKEIRDTTPESGPLAGHKRHGTWIRDLSPIELLTVLFGGVREPLTVAAQLLERHGSLTALAGCTPAELVQARGLGPSGAERLVAAFELGARTRDRPEPHLVTVRGPGDLSAHLLEEFRGRDRERFLALHLDTRHRLRATETVSIGSLNASLVHPREVFRSAVRRGTAALIVAHNHPSGCAEPSCEDLELTVRLSECGRLMGIEVLDHVIVGSGRITSLRERGWPGRDDARPRAADAQEG